MLFVPVSAAPMALPGCPSKCGNVDVPYPFGLIPPCSKDTSFLFQCNDRDYNPPQLFLGNINITGIDLMGTLDVSFFIARDCFSKTGDALTPGSTSTTLRGNPFTVSADRNKFTVVGCDSVAYIVDPDEQNGFSTGCASLCKNISTVENHTCSGIGCCQTSIPKGLKYFLATFQTFSRHTRVWDFNPCSLAFLVDQTKFSFNTSLLTTDFTRLLVKTPVVLDWSIEGDDCQSAQKRTKYACRSHNSYCAPSPNGLGYLCNCSSGYQGNPYLDDGCQDIDECQSPRVYPCKGICTNTPGSYNCSCEVGSHSDDPKTQRCVLDPTDQKLHWTVKLAIGLCSGFLFIMITGSWLYWGFKKRKLMNLKQKFFEQNGGLYLQQLISSGNQTNFKLFTEWELAKATNNYDKGNILGSGGHSIVYKGILDENRMVAVKRSKITEENEKKEFAKELLTLSKINHKNVLKILGCCMEVEVPMLVFEFVPNGTLFNHIYEGKSDFLNSFDARLRVAKEAAEGLSYMHSKADPPILHGDVKPSNILLDADYTVKVSDFGTSTFAPNNEAQITTLVAGTIGYLDPEYLQTCQLTEKSDVYSFGVILVELLTRRKAISYGRSEDMQSTSSTFISYMNKNKLREILDSQIDKEEWLDRIQKVAVIAKQCLSLRGEERPTMTQVMMELEFVRSSMKHSWVETEPKHVKNPDGEHPDCHAHKEQLENKIQHTNECGILETKST